MPSDKTESEISVYESQHISVMLPESLEHLECAPNKNYLDFTFGGGGHTDAILNLTGPGGRVNAFDRDMQAIDSYGNAKDYLDKRLFLHHMKMSEAPQWLNVQKNSSTVNGALLDCGVSSFQLDHPERGFSFMNSGPLDMRMDHQRDTSARDMILRTTENDLKQMIKDYGEENFSGRIARVIKERQHQLLSTQDLVNSIVAAIPNFVKGKKRNAVFARVFQAIRIAVNDEMQEIKTLLDSLCETLPESARIVAISFHSVEDRVIKNTFREKEKEGFVKRINKKVILPQEDELKKNPRSRSAKMRVVECLGRQS